MRIIAGSAKGTRLKMVPGKHVRPTADRVKESLFQVIGPFFAGGNVLDLFAGTGALGLEALSRGFDRGVFVDQSRTSCDIVRMNAEAAKLADRVEIYRRDARAALKMLQGKGWRFELILLDPPYHKNLLLPVLKEIVGTELLGKDGIVVAEHPNDLELEAELGSLVQIRRLAYGDTGITLYQKINE
ncbi:16S rRNA (guanine(966)-N(2))-methyltransferase RsmD [Thermoactinomyces daqus]|jgi:16S rRNA (guanine966-N2)-methyltransferase|uniref:16S rRNA (Guanine(966)-N(2))-methyltransferase RsmD n=1 Tax=Thermoactinomyces daqus TaxID=1329516 RepID=A0A7W1XCJ3_9BACL|nr:16S rRNA (guanine(966)-N(2))-methyltransferase RsmD [Thermoactinomyces daqus]MBA4544042.1 16S rRNA (guanine(966)-N(2))-methyltransferase RsmD [Thermoactinomyces daqus]